MKAATDHRYLLLKYLFGGQGGTFLEIAYLFVDIRKTLPGKSLSVRSKKVLLENQYLFVSQKKVLLENWYLFGSQKRFS